MMKRIRERIKKIPLWGIAAGIGYFALQYGMYRLAELLSRVMGTAEHAIACKIPAIDDRIPIVPVWSVIYLYSYVFWIMGPMAVSLTRKRNFINYICGLTLAYLIGFLFFVFMPTYMDRNAEGLMEAAMRPGVFPRLLKIIYATDGSGKAYNLFPSYHCLISVYCYLGVRKQPEISPGFRSYSLVMAILISLSTVLTKQHYFIDVPGGIAVSVGCYALMERLDLGKRLLSE